MSSAPPLARQWNVALADQTLLLVDDHPLFAEVLARCLFRLADVRGIHLAHDLATARAKLHNFRPDVVLLDCHLGPENGLELISDVIALRSETHVVVLSGGSDPHEVAAAFARGAHGWVSKRGSVEDVLDAVVAVRRGEKYLATSTVGAVMDLLTEQASTPAHAPSFMDRLSPREREVLQFLLAGMSRQEGATQLFLSPNTVRTHVQKLLRSADVHSTLALLAAARRAGVDELANGH